MELGSTRCRCSCSSVYTYLAGPREVYEAYLMTAARQAHLAWFFFPQCNSLALPGGSYRGRYKVSAQCLQSYLAIELSLIASSSPSDLWKIRSRGVL
jgi:hypothetical protein